MANILQMKLSNVFSLMVFVFNFGMKFYRNMLNVFNGLIFYQATLINVMASCPQAKIHSQTNAD